jgi:hypothetical protein
MALPTAAIPTLPTGIGAASPDIQKQYSESVDKVLAALENRGSSIPWFKISAALADPGRTGSAAEGFGRAMGVLGQQRELEEQQALPIAQMRAQLVGQKYQMQKEQDSNKALLNAIGGGNVGDIMQSISSPEGAFGNPQLYQALVRAQILAQPGTEAAAKIDRLLKTQQEMLELGIKQGTLSTQQVESVYKYGAKPGNTSGTFAPNRPATTSGINPNLTSGPAIFQPIPAGSGAAEPPRTDGTVPIGTPSGKTPEEIEEQRGRADTPPAKESVASTAGGYTKLSDTQYQLASGRVMSFPAGTPQEKIDKDMSAFAAEEQKTYEESLRNMGKAEMESWSKKRAALIDANPNQLATQIGDLTNTIKILSNPKFERVVGLLQQKDPNADGTVMGSIINGIRSLAAGAQEGLKIGNYGSISAPVEEMMRVEKFTKEERAAFNEVRRTIASGLIASIQGSGRALGINPTDADRMLYELAATSTSNLAANTIYWAQQRLVQTQFEYAAVKGINNYVGRHPAEYFTSPKSPLTKAQKDYEEKIAKIQSRAPGIRE